MLRNPDHVTVAVADAATAIEFFALLGFREGHVATIDGGSEVRGKNERSQVAPPLQVHSQKQRQRGSSHRHRKMHGPGVVADDKLSLTHQFGQFVQIR